MLTRRLATPKTENEPQDYFSCILPLSQSSRGAVSLITAKAGQIEASLRCDQRIPI